jgi:hypothetical protein
MPFVASESREYLFQKVLRAQNLIQLLDKVHKFVRVLLSCDLGGQLSQSFFVFIFSFRLHGAFPRPIAERPVFGFVRYVRALRNVVQTSQL